MEEEEETEEEKKKKYLDSKFFSLWTY